MRQKEPKVRQKVRTSPGLIRQQDKFSRPNLSEDKDIIVNEISLIILIDGGLGGIDSGK